MTRFFAASIVYHNNQGLRLPHISSARESPFHSDADRNLDGKIVVFEISAPDNTVVSGSREALFNEGANRAQHNETMGYAAGLQFITNRTPERENTSFICDDIEDSTLPDRG